MKTFIVEMTSKRYLTASKLLIVTAENTEQAEGLAKELTQSEWMLDKATEVSTQLAQVFYARTNNDQSGLFMYQVDVAVNFESHDLSENKQVATVKCIMVAENEEAASKRALEHAKVRSGFSARTPKGHHNLWVQHISQVIPPDDNIVYSHVVKAG